MDRKKYMAAWRAANPEKIAAYSKKYQQSHSDFIRAYQRHWRQTNKEKVAAQQLRYWQRKVAAAQLQSETEVDAP